MSLLNSTVLPLPISPDISRFQLILRLLVITLGLTILIPGIFGNIINIVTFTKLGYYKQNACSLYIIARSVFDQLILIFGLGTRILSQGFQIDFTLMSNAWCKLRVSIIYINTLSSYTFLCLQSIDGFFVTSISESLRQRSNPRVARYLLVFFPILWILEELPYLLFQELIVGSAGSKPMCITVNVTYAKYRTYFIYLFLTTIAPLIIIIVFNVLTFRHLHEYSIQQQVRLLSILSKQLTMMTLFHIAAVVMFQAPFAVSQCYFLTVGISKDLVRGAQEQIVQQFFNVLGYGIYSTSFYCYYIASKRFRDQVFSVFLFTSQRRNRVRP